MPPGVSRRARGPGTTSALPIERLRRADAAIEAFERVSRIDPGDADTLYFLGQLHAQARRYDQAIAAFEKCLALDSLHLSAEFGLARAYQLSGNEAMAARHLARFDELTQSKIGKQISLTYGEQGPYSTAEPAAGAEAAPRRRAVTITAGAVTTLAIVVSPGVAAVGAARLLRAAAAGADRRRGDGPPGRPPHPAPRPADAHRPRAPRAVGGDRGLRAVGVADGGAQPAADRARPAADPDPLVRRATSGARATPSTGAARPPRTPTSARSTSATCWRRSGRREPGRPGAGPAGPGPAPARPRAPGARGRLCGVHRPTCACSS